MTEVEWTPNALNLLDGLESEAQERLVKKLDELDMDEFVEVVVERLSSIPIASTSSFGLILPL